MLPENTIMFGFKIAYLYRALLILLVVLLPIKNDIATAVDCVRLFIEGFKMVCV